MLQGLAGLLRTVADRLSPETIETTPSVFLSRQDIEDQRRDDAMSLLDPEVHGYLVVQLRDSGHGSLHLDYQHIMPTPAWPMVNRLLTQIATKSR